MCRPFGASMARENLLPDPIVGCCHSIPTIAPPPVRVGLRRGPAATLSDVLHWASRVRPDGSERLGPPASRTRSTRLPLLDRADPRHLRRADGGRPAGGARPD